MPTDRMARNIQRHHDRLKGAIKKDLPRIIANDDIITAPNGRRLRVPVRYLDEPRFKPARPSDGSGGKGLGSGTAGNEHRDPTVDIELTIDELADLLFEELQLPNLEPKLAEDVEENAAVEGITRQGPKGRLHVKRTIIEHLKHPNAPWREEDFRYKDLRPRERQVTKSVVVFIRDASASMDEEKRYRVRAASFWALRWLRAQYENCEPVFILHDTSAEETDEHTFFHASIMGGTHLSSGVALALQVLGSRFPEAQYNRYVLHFSDGDNWGQDNERLVRLAREIHEQVQLYAFCEVASNQYSKTALDLLKGLGLPRVKVGRVTQDIQVGAWLQATFGVSA